MNIFIEICNKLFDQTFNEIGQVTEDLISSISQLNLDFQKQSKQIFLEEIPSSIVKLLQLSDSPNQFEPLLTSLWNTLIEQKNTIKNYLDIYLLQAQKQIKYSLQVLTEQLQLLTISKTQFTTIEILLKQNYFKQIKEIQQDQIQINFKDPIVQQVIKLPHQGREYDYIFSPADPSIQKILLIQNQIFTGGWDGQVIKQSGEGQMQTAQIHDSPIRQLIKLQTNLLLALDDLNNIAIFDNHLQIKTRYKLNADIQIIRLEEHYDNKQQEHLLYLYLENGNLIKFNLINESDSQTISNDLKGTLLYGDRNNLILTDRFWDDPGVVHIINLDDQGLAVSKQKKKISQSFIEKVVGNYFIDNQQQVYLNEELQNFQASKIFQICDITIIILDQDITVKQGNSEWKFKTQIDEVYDVAYHNGLILVGVGAINYEIFN